MTTTSGPASWIGQELAAGRYLVERKLGEGGMGAVYLAEDRKLEASVVIKSPHRSLLHEGDFADRFTAEIRSLVHLSHPHIVNVMDVDEHDDVPFAVMQYLSGGSLDERPSPAKPKEILKWLPDVAKALDFIHKQDFVHRDIKPGNILFDEHGSVYLGDFGIAKALAATDGQQRRNVTATGMIVGTPEYMAPEMIMGNDYDGRSDQYALGITVYQLLCGRRPFQEETSAAYLVAHTTKTPPPIHEVQPSLSKALAEVIARSLAKSPDDRFGRCMDFARGFAAALRTPPPTRPGNAGGTEIVSSPVSGTPTAPIKDLPTAAPLDPVKTPPPLQRTQTQNQSHQPTAVQQQSPPPVTRPVSPPAAVTKDETQHSPTSKRRMWVAGAAISALLAIGLTVAIILLVRSGEEPGVEPGPRVDARYIPTDAFAAIVIHPRRALQSDIEKRLDVKGFLDAVPADEAVFDVTKMDQVIVVFTAGGDGPAGEPVGIFRFNEPYDKQEVLSRPQLRRKDRLQYDGKPFYGSEEYESSECWAFPDNRTMIVAGSRSEMEAVLSADSSSSLGKALQEMDTNNDIFAVVQMAPIRSSLRAELEREGDDIPPAFSNLPNQIDTITATGHLDPEPKVDIVITATSNSAAEDLEAAITMALSLASLQMGELREEAEREMGYVAADRMVTVLDKLITGVKPNIVGKEVHVSVTAPDGTDDLIDELGKVIERERQNIKARESRDKYDGDKTAYENEKTYDPKGS